MQAPQRAGLLRLFFHTQFCPGLKSLLISNERKIIIEYCESGSLGDIMRLCKKVFEELDIAYIVHYTLQGLNYLHSRNIIHRGKRMLTFAKLKTLKRPTFLLMIMKSK